MEVASKTNPVDACNRNVISTAPTSKPLDRPTPPISSDQHRVEQSRQVKADIDKKIANSIKKFLTLKDVRLEFSIDNNTDEITVRIIRKNSDKIVREISAKAILDGAGIFNETV